MNEREKIAKFFKENKERVENPLIRGFLSNEKNLNLLEKYIVDPSDINKSKVDVAFKLHYTRVLKIKYVSNLIKFFSMDFDKKRRKENEKMLLILDNSTNDGSTLIKDQIQDKNTKQYSESGFLESIENVVLIDALKTLTDKQLMILELIYHRQLTQKRLAEILKTTPQNVSNIHRKSLKKLNNLLKREGHSKVE